MELAKPVLGLGADFIPVPGLKVAFTTLEWIWQTVEKASTNRRALRNMGVSMMEVVLAIDHVVRQGGEFDGHVRRLLRTLEKVLEEFLEFAQKHSSMNLFKVLIKNVDVEGEIERFQSRMQGLLTAFTISALGRIDSRVEMILEGKKAKRVVDYKEVHVRASFSEPCRISAVDGQARLTCAYFPDVDMDIWGVRVPGSRIVFERENKFWKWVLAHRQIKVHARDTWEDSITLVAEEWFEWVRKKGKVPEERGVWVRKKYDCWMRKTEERIERLPPGNKRWKKVVAAGKIARVEMSATHVTYKQRGGGLAWTRVYRCGDTIVVELSGEKEGEIVATRRYRFEGPEEGRRWYAAWRAIAESEY